MGGGVFFFFSGNPFPRRARNAARRFSTFSLLGSNFAKRGLYQGVQRQGHADRRGHCSSELGLNYIGRDQTPHLRIAGRATLLNLKNPQEVLIPHVIHQRGAGLRNLPRSNIGESSTTGSRIQFRKSVSRGGKPGAKSRATAVRFLATGLWRHGGPRIQTGGHESRRRCVEGIPSCCGFSECCNPDRYYDVGIRRGRARRHPLPGAGLASPPPHPQTPPPPHPPPPRPPPPTPPKALRPVGLRSLRALPGQRCYDQLIHEAWLCKTWRR